MGQIRVLNGIPICSNLYKVYGIPASHTVPHLSFFVRVAGSLESLYTCMRVARVLRLLHHILTPHMLAWWCCLYITCWCTVDHARYCRPHALAGIGHMYTCSRTHVCHGLVCLLPHAFIITGHVHCWIIASVIDHIPLATSLPHVLVWLGDCGHACMLVCVMPNLVIV